MEHVLQKLARQLDALDEASLASYWDKYYATASHFEPSKRWEESVLILSLIQAKRWKNQLFNQQWASQSMPDDNKKPRIMFNLETEDDNPDKNRAKAKILSFKKVSVDDDSKQSDSID